MRGDGQVERIFPANTKGKSYGNILQKQKHLKITRPLVFVSAAGNRVSHRTILQSVEPMRDAPFGNSISARFSKSFSQTGPLVPFLSGVQSFLRQGNSYKG